MFGEVNIEVQDGNLGRNTSTGSFVQVKIGPLPIAFAIPQLRCCVSAPDIFGAGPLD